MEIKKSQNADLENKKFLFMEVGLVIALTIVLIAFEWSSSSSTKLDYQQVNEGVAEEEIIPITRMDEPKQAAILAAPKVIDVLNIVKDNVALKEDLIINSESDNNTEVQVQQISNVEFEVEVEAEETEEAPIFFIVEEMPEFPGGQAMISAFINANVKYPIIAQENGIQGKVYVNFVVNAKGVVENVKILRGVDPSLDKEAIRVISSMPTWKPGKQRNKAVKVSYTLPVSFVLQ